MLTTFSAGKQTIPQVLQLPGNKAREEWMNSLHFKPSSVAANIQLP